MTIISNIRMISNVNPSIISNTKMVSNMKIVSWISVVLVLLVQITNVSSVVDYWSEDYDTGKNHARVGLRLNEP